MAAQYWPQNGVAYTFYIGLRSQADSTIFKNTPTLAAGDFKVSIDGGALNNLATLPTNTPAASAQIKIALSAGEMTGDNITVECIDAAGAEWFSEIINIQTLPANATTGILDVNAKQINSVAATSVTTINANVGTTQPENFTGTGASALVKADMVDIAGSAVSTSTAQIGVNAVQLNAQTVSAAAGVTFPSSVASPTNITAGTITTATNLTNAPTAGDLTATMKASVTTAATASTPTAAAVTGAVGSVTGNIGGNVAGSVASVTAPVTLTAAYDPAKTAAQEPQGIKKNTVRNAFTFPIASSTDHLTPQTGLTVTATRSIDGTVFGACANAVTEIGTTGFYKIDFAASDLNGDIVQFKMTPSAGGDLRAFTVVTST